MVPRKIINAYPRFKEFKDLAAAGDNVAAVRKGLDFLRFAGREYERKQVYDHVEWDGDDFYTREAEEILANVLRNDRTPKECVEMAQKEIAEIEAMEAYDDYCLAFFDNVHEALDFRLADAARYIEEMDRQIERHSKDYRKDLEEGNFEVFCALGRYNALNDLLEKKIDYLNSLGDEKGIEKVVEDFLYMPSVSAYVVNGLINDGKDEEAIAAIDKVLSVFRSDRFTASAQLHLKKALLLERKGDRMGVAEEYRRVFRQQLSNKRLYFERMKDLVPKEEWDEFAVKAFEDIPCCTDSDCGVVCDLIVEEKKYQCLLKILKQNGSSFHRTEYFKRYARYMNEEDQRAYADFVIDDLRLRLRYADSGSYHYIVDEIMLLCSTCEVTKSIGINFVAEIIVKYRNRRALMRELT
ncbi:MAG: hypothetical protein ACI4BA_05630, partial [Prevotella sp.]